MNISDNVQLMKSYIFYAMTFERNVYMWNNALNKINEAINSNHHRKIGAMNNIETINDDIDSFDDEYKEAIKAKNKSIRNNKRIIICASIIFSIILVACIIYYITSKEIGALYTGGYILFFFILIIVVDLKKYRSEIQFEKRYIKNHLNEQSKIDKLNQLRNKKQVQEKLVMDLSYKEVILIQDRDDIIKNLNEAKKILSNIYSKNILPSRYRNLVATCTLFQYLDTGRCTIIKGHGGIYDTFEYELQMKSIIYNLKEINMKLDTVISNQNRLYQEINIANSTLNSMERDFKVLRDNTDTIKKSSSVAAVAQQQTMENTRYINDLLHKMY